MECVFNSIRFTSVHTVVNIMTTAKDYGILSDDKLINEAAKRLSLNEMWAMLAKVRMTRPETRDSMRSKIIKQLNLLDEYGVH